MQIGLPRAECAGKDTARGAEVDGAGETIRLKRAKASISRSQELYLHNPPRTHPLLTISALCSSATTTPSDPGLLQHPPHCLLASTPASLQLILPTSSRPVLVEYELDHISPLTPNSTKPSCFTESKTHSLGESPACRGPCLSLWPHHPPICTLLARCWPLTLSAMTSSIHPGGVCTTSCLSFSLDVASSFLSFRSHLQCQPLQRGGF